MDIIGTIYTPAVLDAEGNVTTEPQAIPGWHINMPEAVAGWEQHQVFPETPMRVYAGHETVCYSFQDEAAFTAAAIEAGLLPAPELVDPAPNEATP